MKIDKNNIKAIFEFSPRDYILVYEKGRDFEWSLNFLIDRSDKGKDPDIGSPAIFLTDEEAKQLKTEGFGWTEM